MQNDAEKTHSQLKSLQRTPKVMDGHLNPKSFRDVTGHFITVPIVNPKLHCVMLIVLNGKFGSAFSFENFNCNFLENTNMLMKHKNSACRVASVQMLDNITPNHTQPPVSRLAHSSRQKLPHHS